MTLSQSQPKLKVCVSAKRTRRTHYAISDSPLTGDAAACSIGADDLVSYLQAKQEFEKWQERLRSAKRWGGGRV